MHPVANNPSFPIRQLTNVKTLQTANVQLDTSDAVSRAVSDASADANLRPSTSLVLAELAARSGRAFSETADINKLLECVRACARGFNMQSLCLKQTNSLQPHCCEAQG